MLPGKELCELSGENPSSHCTEYPVGVVLRNKRQNYWGVQAVGNKLCVGTWVQPEPLFLLLRVMEVLMEQLEEGVGQGLELLLWSAGGIRTQLTDCLAELSAEGRALSAVLFPPCGAQLQLLLCKSACSSCSREGRSLPRSRGGSN